MRRGGDCVELWRSRSGWRSPCAPKQQERLAAEVEALEEEERRAATAFHAALQAYAHAHHAALHAAHHHRRLLLAPALHHEPQQQTHQHQQPAPPSRTPPLLLLPPSSAQEPPSLASAAITTKGALFRTTLLAHTLAQSSGEDSGLSHDILTWELKREEIKTLDEAALGKGAFGTVSKGILRGKPVAVKKIHIGLRRDGQIDERTSEVLEDFRNECAVMSKLLHPNVLLLMGVCIDQEVDELLMVTELMENGSDCALGLNYLHLNKPNPILHLDLKTANLLVDANFVTKVADFGLAKVYGLKDRKGVGGTPYYMSPEVLDGEDFDSKSDVYAFAIILWELITQKIPYSDEKLRSGPAGLAQLYSHIPGDCPPKLRRLVEQCWAPDPAARPSFQDILDSRILDEVVLDETISEANSLARTFWKECFCVKGELLYAVEWKQFARVLAQWCEIGVDVEKDIYWKALRMVLVPENEDVVTLERFSAILEWFGPFAKGKKLLQNVVSTIKIKGFYGDATSDQMGIVFAGKSVGTYLIRFSAQHPGFFTITTLTSRDNLQNYRVSHAPGKAYWLTEDKSFPSLRKLVKHYKAELSLKTPFTGSKYSQLLVQIEEGERVNLYSNFSTTTAASAATTPVPLKKEKKEKKEKKGAGAKKKHPPRHAAAVPSDGGYAQPHL
ncbi:protein kinase domain containing protein [Acanthamoeba castellanii str. Neff]|uniref:Protein kinase domain containing protein n=1 Tax=Acanthamoeba castellanii (strain ATCC 30010 / Neff) TaxID=1257118 RepID=L8GVT2_ACACF|nr:protein kinase domain containing protein [Acanthamoeba castellanii str. Neff]ELR16181.1 protein kinase domain containing protein [Acanthamoeba castellanii str. Neff]